MKNKIEYIIIKNKRNPNIDFIRVFGMFSIVIHHLIYHGKAKLKYIKYKELELLTVLLMWHVSSFGIISGMIGNKTHKFSNLLYLWILVLFYTLIFYIIFNKIDPNVLIAKFFPVIHHEYWYFSAYFGIYPFLPFINMGINTLSQIVIKKSIYFMILAFFILAVYYFDTFGLRNGYSPFCLLIYYIFGAYAGKFIFHKIKLKIYRRSICLMCFLIFMSSSLLCYNVRTNQNLKNLEYKLKGLLKGGIFSFPILFQVFSIIIFVAQINFNIYISNVFTFLGPITFDVYLIHENIFVRRIYISNIFNNNSNNLSLFNVLILITSKALLIFFICIFFGYIRAKIFSIFKIRNICILIESFSTKLLAILP